METVKHIWGVLRIAMGWIFLWGFLDKLFGLGYSTDPENAWLAGGSPTTGFLKHATEGPLADFYQNLAGLLVVDIVFMMGLCLIGISLLFGIMTKIAGYSGALMMILMYTAALPPASNPVIDNHIIYALVLISFAVGSAGDYVGFGKRWKQSEFVQKHTLFT